MLESLPTNLPLRQRFSVYQAYLSIEPEVRIWRKVRFDVDIGHFLAIKCNGSLAQKEVEIEISNEQFYALVEMVKYPFISKEVHIYQLPDNLELECSLVDKRLDTKFMYAEVRFPNIKDAALFEPPFEFLSEITDDTAYRMKDYWERTRI